MDGRMKTPPSPATMRLREEREDETPKFFPIRARAHGRVFDGQKLPFLPLARLPTSSAGSDPPAFLPTLPCYGYRMRAAYSFLLFLRCPKMGFRRCPNSLMRHGLKPLSVAHL